jgi:hypothetical protein
MATDWNLLFAPNSISEMPKLINAANQAEADRQTRLAMANQQAMEMDFERAEKQREYDQSGKNAQLAQAAQANAQAGYLQQQTKNAESEPSRDIYKANLQSQTPVNVANINSGTQLATTGMQTGTQLAIEDKKNSLLMQQMALQQANLDREAKLKQQEIGISQQQANTSSASQQNQGMLIGSQVLAAQGALNPFGRTLYPQGMALDGSLHPVLQNQSQGPNLGVPGVDRSWTLQQSTNPPQQQQTNNVSSAFGNAVQQQSTQQPWTLQQNMTQPMVARNSDGSLPFGVSSGASNLLPGIPGAAF